MALGAFIAGVLLADSEYRHELEADIEPFKGLLLGLFFIAVGMSANLGLLAAMPGRVLALTCAYLLLKCRRRVLAARLTRHGPDTAWRLGVALAGGGEFAFVLFTLATRARLIDPEAADLLVIVVTVSLMLAPLLIAAADLLATRLAPPAPPPRFDDIEPEEPRVLIAGFGRFGQIVARVLRARHIRFTALEINQAQVDFVRRFGNKLYYGDASRLEMLRAAGAEPADVLVLAIDDVEASVRTAEMARRHFPKLRVLARARNRQHAFRLLETGVDEIWRETFASSLELAEAALVALGTARETAAAAGEALPGTRRGDDATAGGRERRRGEADRDHAGVGAAARETVRGGHTMTTTRRQRPSCLRRAACAAVATLAWLATGLPARAAPALDEAAAARFAQLALACAHLEYPNKIAHTLQGPADVRAAARADARVLWLLRLAFVGPCRTGCWPGWRRPSPTHRSRRRRARPSRSSLTAANVAGEVAYLRDPGRASFERPYGLAWLLALAAELKSWPDPEAQQWSPRLAAARDRSRRSDCDAGCRSCATRSASASIARRLSRSA